MGTDPLTTHEADNIIVAKQIFKTYSLGNVEVTALHGVDLTVERGEMLAIMGPSGSGKTTLLNCLSGLDDFDQGDVLIDGTSLRSMSDRKRTTYRAQSMGFVFQSYNLLPVLSAVENVELPLLVSDTRPAEARKQALYALEQVGLEDRSTHRPAELSGGQRQRVTIARALVNDPVIIWADEPTGNLDIKTAENILAIMRRLNQENRQTFVIVTHAPVVAKQCDRVISVSDGQIIEDRLIEQYALKVEGTDESIFQPKLKMVDSSQLAGDSA